MTADTRLNTMMTDSQTGSYSSVQAAKSVLFSVMFIVQLNENACHGHIYSNMQTVNDKQSATLV